MQAPWITPLPAPNAAHSVPMSEDLARVLALPRRVWSEESQTALAVWLTDQLRTGQVCDRCGGARGHVLWGAAAGCWYLDPSHPERARITPPLSLRGVQAVVLYELYIGHGSGGYGVYMQVPVGGGKTLIFFLAPLMTSARRPLHLLPSGLRADTLRLWDLYARYWKSPYPLPRVESFQQLTQRGSVDMLGTMAPDLLGGDECDKAKDLSRSVGKRIGRYVDEVRCNCTVLLGSGTNKRKSLRDDNHFMTWCLRERTPGFLTDDALSAACLALDEESRVGAARLHPGKLLELADAVGLPLVNPAAPSVGMLDRARNGYRIRVEQTPGIVIHDQSECDLPITIDFVLPDPDPELERRFEWFRMYGKTPDDILMPDALTRHKHAQEIGAGFYYAQVDEDKWNKCQGILSAFTNTHPTNLSGDARKLAQDAQQTLSRIGSETGRDILTEILSGLGPRDSNTDTVLQLLSTIDCARSTPVGVGFATDSQKRTGLPSTTTTLKGSFGGFSVFPATKPSVCLETLKNVSSALYSICLAACRPPDSWSVPRRTWNQFVANQIFDSQHCPHKCRHAGPGGAPCMRKPLDTPLAVEGAFPLADELLAWRAVRDTFKPLSVPTWLSYSVVTSAARFAHEQWIQKGDTGIIWSKHSAFSQVLSQATGFPFYGAKGERIDQYGRAVPGDTIESACTAAAKAGRLAPVAILSIDANHRGRNLQAYANSLNIGWEQAGTRVEQKLGRTHRSGQTRPVRDTIMVTCGEVLDSFYKTISEARFVKSQGLTHKILTATIDKTGLRAYPRDDMRYVRRD